MFSLQKQASFRLNCLHQQDLFFGLTVVAPMYCYELIEMFGWGSCQKLIDWCAKITYVFIYIYIQIYIYIYICPTRFSFLMDEPMEKHHQKPTQQTQKLQCSCHVCRLSLGGGTPMPEIGMVSLGSEHWKPWWLGDAPFMGPTWQWIGLLGKILTGNPWVFTIKYRGFRLKFTRYPSLWTWHDTSWYVVWHLLD